MRSLVGVLREAAGQAIVEAARRAILRRVFADDGVVRVANTLSFEIDEIDGGALSLTPCVDGTLLTVLVSEFEQSSGYIPTGGSSRPISTSVHWTGTSVDRKEARAGAMPTRRSLFWVANAEKWDAGHSELRSHLRTTGINGRPSVNPTDLSATMIPLAHSCSTKSSTNMLFVMPSSEPGRAVSHLLRS